MRKFLLLILLIVVGLAIIAVATGIVPVTQTQEARLPTLEGGQLPAFDVDTPKVEVGTVNKTVEVPVVDVRKGGE